VVNQRPDRKSFADVVEVWLALPAEAMEHANKECEVLGLSIDWETRPASLCRKGDQLKLYVRPAKGSPGIKAIKFALRKAMPAQEIRLGATVLKVEGATATWIFESGFSTETW
jgi:hypothetical protein